MDLRVSLSPSSAAPAAPPHCPSAVAPSRRAPRPPTSIRLRATPARARAHPHVMRAGELVSVYMAIWGSILPSAPARTYEITDQLQRRTHHEHDRSPCPDVSVTHTLSDFSSVPQGSFHHVKRATFDLMISTRAPLVLNCSPIYILSFRTCILVHEHGD